MSNSELPAVEGTRYYGGSVTTAGRGLITSLIAGETIEITRVVVGSGMMPDGVEPIDMTALVEPREEATSSVPIVEDGSISMIVEYRTDMNGGLTEGFWIREFGIFAKTNKSPEILLYYATLGNSPQPVSPFKDNRVDTRRYPVTIELFVDAAVEVSYKPGAFVTSEEARALLNSMVKDTMNDVLGSTIATDVTIPTEGWTLDSKGWYELRVPNEHTVAAQVPFVSFTRESLATTAECGMCASCNAVHGALVFWSRSIPEREIKAVVTLISEPTPSAGHSVINNVVIPTEGWVQDGDSMRLDMEDRSILSSFIPHISLHRDSMETAVNCGMEPSVETLNGKLRFWAMKVPEEEIKITLVLFTPRTLVNSGPYTDLPVATADTPGIIRASDTLRVDADGTAHAVTRTASPEDVDAMLEKVFGAEGENKNGV